MAETQSNSRVIAVLGEKIDTLGKKIDRIETRLERMEDNRLAIGKLETAMKTNCEDVNQLESRVNGWGVINSIGVAVAAIVGVFIPKP